MSVNDISVMDFSITTSSSSNSSSWGPLPLLNESATWWEQNVTDALLNNSTDATTEVDNNANITGFFDQVTTIVNESDANPVQMKQVWFTLRIGLAVSFGTYLFLPCSFSFCIPCYK